ncbi:cation:proton antiporter, partial [Corynebacterium sp. 35RC1]|nr:cation:proton antiporter [Corynebacterium sp. 35RC1]
FEHWALVLGLVMAPVLFKFVLIALLARVFGSGGGAAIRTALGLAQAGEFGFVLLNQIDGMRLIDPLLGQAILAAMLLSMLLAPFLIQYSNPIVMKLVASDWLQQSLQMTTIARKAINTSGHVLICGYGRCGQN